MKIGDIVSYTMEFDADVSYSPNIGPAVVTRVLGTEDTPSLELVVFSINGVFFKEGVVQGNGRGQYQLISK